MAYPDKSCCPPIFTVVKTRHDRTKEILGTFVSEAIAREAANFWITHGESGLHIETPGSEVKGYPNGLR